jgi:competence protein ComEA
LIVLLAVFWIVLVVRYARNRATIPDPQPAVGARTAELVNQIDPNRATWEELAAIPGLGEKRARAIVARREQLLRDHPGELPFREPDDLRRVKGIGPATVSNLMPYLAFPSSVQTRP